MVFQESREFLFFNEMEEFIKLAAFWKEWWNFNAKRTQWIAWPFDCMNLYYTSFQYGPNVGFLTTFKI